MTIAFEIRTPGPPIRPKGLGKSEHPECEITLHLDHIAFGRRYRQRVIASYAEHSALLAALLRAPASVVLSSYSSELYDVPRTRSSRMEIPTTTSQGGTRQERNEVACSNRQTAQPTLFDVEAV
jgi:hypothetical protein